MRHLSSRSLLATLATVVLLLPSEVSAQTRNTGQVVGTVKDSSGAVVPNAALVLIDTGAGTTQETKSSPEGGFLFPNLQPGTYSLTANASGFQPVTLQEVVVQVARSTDVVVTFQLAGVTEQVNVAAATPVVETTATTIANTVGNDTIAKLPLSGRNILNFALLVPGTATSSGARDSEYNGLPGGAIAITLDGINDNSARFRSGGTSFFVFAPIRLGAIEEVTVSTAGLTAEAGAEGAVSIQFATKRGTNKLHGQVFDTIQSDKLNANSVVNAARNIPKTKLKQHEYGGNLGGPIVKNKLFFFANYEQVYQPSETTISRNVLTSEAQQGIFRYTATDNSVRTINLLDLARANRFPSAIDPFVAAQLQTVNGALGQGDIASSTNLLVNSFRFINPQIPNTNIYPTARVDYQATPSLAVRGVLNLQWRDLPTNPRYPGLPSINDGFTSNYYILSTGADWTLRPNMFNQASFGFQSNFEEFRPGNTLSIYEPQGNRRVIFPALNNAVPTATNPTMFDSPQITADQLPIPRNNPVYNLFDTLTWLKGNHTFMLGGSFRRTTMYESIGGAPVSINLAVAAGDPVSSIFNATTIPGVRTADLSSALALYALLTGRISSASETYNIKDGTTEYGLNPILRKEGQNVGGVYAQDQWRINPHTTFNYGLRWEFSGAAYNRNGVYSSTTVADLLGPSTAPFQPGVLNGSLNPQVYLLTHPYKSDWNNPSPNVGMAWNPDKPEGWLGTLVGHSVYGANFGVNYYDEGLITFQTAAGNGPGPIQSRTLDPGQPGFPPGGLTLESTLPPFAAFPTEFAFPIPQQLFTFSRGQAAFDPDIRTPYILNWTVRYQRELWKNAAIEVRYVANRSHQLWRLYNLNETNLFENGFLQEFRNAQQNLAVNAANGRAGFANNNLPGQVPLPIFDAAFGARGSIPAVPANSGYTNQTFITQLQQGQAGRLANSLASNSIYLCAMTGNALPECARRGYNASGPYAINFFQANPFGAGSAMRLLSDEGSAKYDSLQLQFRQRYNAGLTLTANYTYGKARTDRYPVSADNTADYNTLRDKSLNWGPTAYDLRHTFQTYWTYELPFGQNRHFNINNAVVDQILGGWSASGIVKIQTGRPFLLTSGRQTFNQQDAGVILNGITVNELQTLVKVSPGTNGNVFFLDPKLIGADGRSNPQYITYPTTPGELGQYVYLYGPGLWTADLGLAKTFRTGGGSTFNFETLFINAFNHRNTIVGSTGGATLSIDSTTFGQTTTTAIGARQIQFRIGVNF
jgi:Carboxypeptidase regulatory-like domain